MTPKQLNNTIELIKDQIEDETIIKDMIFNDLLNEDEGTEEEITLKSELRDQEQLIKDLKDLEWNIKRFLIKHSEQLPKHDDFTEDWGDNW